jgi:transcriptional regulator GlxA family with amidase domain
VKAEPKILDVETFVRRVARPYQSDDRLWRIWEAVVQDPVRNWKLNDLAKIGCVSPEHLRRLCQQQLSRSPIRHVTYLRMRRVVHYLTTSHDRAETIGQAVEYESPLTFSNAFKRWTGKRPSEFRE